MPIPNVPGLALCTAKAIPPARWGRGNKPRWAASKSFGSDREVLCDLVVNRRRGSRHRFAQFIKPAHGRPSVPALWFSLNSLHTVQID